MTSPIRVLLATSLAGLLGLAACGQPPDPKTGRWHAWLDSPGGELPFGLELSSEASGAQAYLVNGDERARVARTEWHGDDLTLRIEQYDSTVTATMSADGRRLDGLWEKTSGPNDGIALAAETVEQLVGRWAVDFAQDDQPAIGLFEADQDGSVTGTFLTTTGDYRYLEGTFDGERLRLSCFDGAHAFLFDARHRAGSPMTDHQRLGRRGLSWYDVPSSGASKHVIQTHAIRR